MITNWSVPMMSNARWVEARLMPNKLPDWWCIVWLQSESDDGFWIQDAEGERPYRLVQEIRELEEKR